MAKMLVPMLCILLTLTGGVLPAAGAESASYAVVVHRDVPVDHLSLIDLRKIYSGDRQFWNAGLRIVPLIRTPVTRERAAVVWLVCRMTEGEYGKHWIGKLMRAEASGSPKQFSTNPIAFNLVDNIPGSIAIVNAAQVPAGMKIVKVEGAMPGEPKYPLVFQD